MRMVLKNLMRGIKLIKKLDKWYLTLLSVYGVINVLLPLIMLIYSTKIINIITYELNYNSLIEAIIQIIVIEVFLTLTKEICSAKLEVHQNEWDIKVEGFFLDVNNKMKFVDLENSATSLLKNRINTNKNATGAGINNVITIFYTGISEISAVFIAITMTFELFSATAAQDIKMISGWLVVCVIIVFTGICVGYSSYLDCILYKRECFQWASLPETNRLVNYFKTKIKANIGAMDIRIYDMEPKITEEFRKNAVNSVNIDNINEIHILLGKRKKMVVGIFWVFTYVMLAVEAYYGNIKMGYFIEYSGAMICLLNSVSSLISLVGRVIENDKYLCDFYSYIDLSEDDNDKINLKPNTNLNVFNSLVVKNVCYKYPTASQNTLEDISVTIESGKRYAIVGENGSGKTTFIKLLAGLYEPITGEIMINGVNYNSILKQDLFSFFSVVFQDFSLFSFSLGQNIRGGNGCDDMRVSEIIKQVGFAERFESMPKGLETNIFKDFDQDGVLLSGGEQQKIALARALYKDSPIFLLDEPTSAMDPIAEADLFKRLSEMTNSRTSLFVSHRLSSCCFCDEIIVFDNGHIVQRGTHEQLLKDKKGKYSVLWNAQANYYKEKKDN